MSGESQRLLHLALLGEAIEYLEGVAVFVWNDERNYVAVNDAACDLVGMPREELIRMPVGTLTPDRAAGDVERVRGEGPVDGASSFTRPDGEVVELRWTTGHTHIAGLPYMVSVCRRVV